MIWVVINDYSIQARVYYLKHHCNGTCLSAFLAEILDYVNCAVKNSFKGVF